MTKRYLALPASALVALSLAACGNDNKNESSSPSTSPSTTAKAAAAFTAPKADQKVGSKFTAEVKLSNFQLDPKDVGKKPVPGKGHLHFSLDGGKYDYPKYSGPNGELAKKLGVTGKYSPSVTPQITYKGIPKGKHTLKVELANNDHSPEGATATVSFAVK